MTPTPGGGIPAGFVVLFILVALVGVAGTIWRVSAARKLARDAGLDENAAGAMSLLTQNGLDATYLAASLKPHTAPVQAPAGAGPGKSVEQRLQELQGLLDRGLVSQAEYDGRRKQILDSI